MTKGLFLLDLVMTLAICLICLTVVHAQLSMIQRDMHQLDTYQLDAEQACNRFILDALAVPE